ncbi:MAG: tetratricopeptide repeat protein [Defluviitaleaceae bacterium]|nr:tetratricopeptide repeat protein [Defluviitaleaceae bacterium]
MFIGREEYIQELEDAMQEKPACIIIHGLLGEGKTALVKHWLKETPNTLWFDFNESTNLDSIVDAIANEIGTADAELFAHLHKNKYVIVWDNFDIQADKQPQYAEFLKKLNGGETKVIITSRKREVWLSSEDCSRVQLRWLNNDDLWKYCDVVANDVGITELYNNDENYADIWDLLDRQTGNALAIRIAFQRLAEFGDIQKVLEQCKNGLDTIEGEENTSRLHAALSAFENGHDFARILRLIGLHVNYVDADNLYDMMDGEVSEDFISECFAALEHVGLSRPSKYKIHQIHSVLRGYLNRAYPATEDEQRDFIDVMSQIADRFCDHESEDIRKFVFNWLGANFKKAARLALALDMSEDILVLVQSMGVHAKNENDIDEAMVCFELLAEMSIDYGDKEGESSAYHHLGEVALMQRDFDAAEAWYKKSLDMDIELNDESGIALNRKKLELVTKKRKA